MTEAKILIPKTVVLRSAIPAQIHEALMKSVEELTKTEKVSKDAGEALLATMREHLPAVETNYAIDEFVETVLNTGPQFRGGAKSTAMAWRIQEAFNGAKEGDIVRLSVDAQEKLKGYFEAPQHVAAPKEGAKAETVEGWAPGLNAYTVRQAYPYIRCICEPLKEESEKKSEEKAA